MIRLIILNKGRKCRRIILPCLWIFSISFFIFANIQSDVFNVTSVKFTNFGLNSFSVTPKGTNNDGRIDYNVYWRPINGINQENEDILRVLGGTPYLWRRFDMQPNETSRSRIQAQQRWVQQISTTKYIAEAKRKIILLEDDVELYHWSGEKVQCPYAPSFENKCDLRFVPQSPVRIFMNLWKKVYGMVFGYDCDALISVRNWDSQMTFAIPPKGVFHIIFILESPSIAKDAHLGYTNAVLASYWRGSDIPVPYHIFVPNVRNFSEETPGLDEVALKIKSKTKLVAAMISNCRNSDRLDYIHELQKFVDVDVYGACGIPCQKYPADYCFKMFEEKYKFYLAFENSRCEDYITEKLFANALGYYIVPVVRGARKSDYLYASPTNSFIHVDDFDSAETLAEYLKYLDKDQEAYLKYFEWKGSGIISKQQFTDFFCRTCAMMFYSEFIPPPNWSSNDIMWKDVNFCLSPDIGPWPK